MKTLYKYKIYGLTVESVIELPDLIAIPSGTPDVQINIGMVPESLSNPIDTGIFYQATKNDFLFRFDKVGAYRIQDGNKITVQVIGEIEDVRLFLLGSAFGALLHQKGILAIHGSAISTPKGAIIFSGSSSVGKSSLVASLVKRGFNFIADDIAAIHKHTDGFKVHPGIPHIKLWKDVVKDLNIKNNLPKVRDSMEKYKNPIGNEFFKIPININKIIILSVKNSPGYVIREIKGAEKFEILDRNTYRNHYIKGLQTSQIHFEHISYLASSTPIFQVQRPSSPLNVNELTEFVIKKFITQ